MNCSSHLRNCSSNNSSSCDFSTSSPKFDSFGRSIESRLFQLREWFCARVELSVDERFHFDVSPCSKRFCTGRSLVIGWADVLTVVDWNVGWYDVWFEVETLEFGGLFRPNDVELLFVSVADTGGGGGGALENLFEQKWRKLIDKIGRIRTNGANILCTCTLIWQWRWRNNVWIHEFCLHFALILEF